MLFKTKRLNFENYQLLVAIIFFFFVNTIVIKTVNFIVSVDIIVSFSLSANLKHS